MKLNFHISDEALPPFVGIYASSNPDLTVSTSDSAHLILKIDLPSDTTLAQNIAHNVQSCISYANSMPLPDEFTAISVMFKALPANVSAVEYISGAGGWGLSESEQLVINALAQALVLYPYSALQ